MPNFSYQPGETIDQFNTRVNGYATSYHQRGYAQANAFLNDKGSPIYGYINNPADPTHGFEISRDANGNFFTQGSNGGGAGSSGDVYYGRSLPSGFSTTKPTAPSTFAPPPTAFVNATQPTSPMNPTQPTQTYNGYIVHQAADGTSFYDGPTGKVNLANGVPTPAAGQSATAQPTSTGNPQLDQIRQQALAIQSKLGIIAADPAKRAAFNAGQDVSVSPIPGTIQPPSQSGAPSLPQAQAPSVADQFNTSLSASLQAQQQQLEQALQTQQQSYQTKTDALTQQQHDLQQLEDAGMTNMNSAIHQETQQKQAALEQEQQQFQQNYDARQALTGQLQTLLTTGQQVIEQMKGTTGLASIMSPRISQTMTDVQGQAGVISATLAAYSDQIGLAQNQLKTSLDAITSIYKDQTDYWSSVVNFYDGQKKDVEGQITSLSKDQKSYIDAQIQMLQDKATQTHETAQVIQQAMLDPTKALAYAKAGVSLTDSPAQISQKLATYEQAQQAQWSAPQKLGGDYIQTNKLTGETRTVVSNIATPGAAGGGVVVSGTLNYTKADKAADSQALEQSRGSDGYVDPTIYQNLYKAWISHGGTASGFVSTYPPKDYVNPANTWLPAVLRPKSTNSLQQQIDSLNL